VHFNALRDDLKSFADDKPYRAVANHNADFTEHTLSVEFMDRSVFHDWGLMLGDCVHNMRSALDGAIYEVAIRESGIDPPPNERTLMFPITKDKDEFKKHGQWRIKTLSDPIQAIIEFHQPYNRGSQPLDRAFLWRLNEFDAADKHRTIRLTCLGLTEGSGFLNVEAGDEISFTRTDGPLETGTPFLTITSEHPMPNVKMKDPQVEVRVALESRFDDNVVPELLDPLSVLRGFRNAAGRVIDALERALHD